MLIRSIRAENFMRFENLALRRLPERGLIGIEGPNESGKTTIGDAILFALFGKTPKNDELPVSRLIRWNADRMFVELEFVVGDGRELLLYREIDKYGTNYVKLLESESRREIAAGHVNVKRALSRVLRFDSLDFLGAFYLGQHHSALGNGADPEFLDRMTGTHQIGEAIEEIQREVEQIEREHAHYNKDVERNRRQIEKLAARVAGLEQQREAVERLTRDLSDGEGRGRTLEARLKSLRRFADDLGKCASRLEGSADTSIAEIATTLDGIPERYRAFEDASSGRRVFLDANEALFSSQEQRCRDLLEFAREFTALARRLGRRAADLSRRLSPGEGGLVDREYALQELVNRQGRRCFRLSIWTLIVLVVAGGLGVAAGLAGDVAAGSVPGYLGFGVASAGMFTVFASMCIVRAVAGGSRRAAEEKLRRLQKEMRDVRGEQQAIEAALAEGAGGEVEQVWRTAGFLADHELRADLEALRRRFEAYGAEDGEREYRGHMARLVEEQRELREKVRKEAQKVEKKYKEIVSESRRARSEKNRLENEVRETESSFPKMKRLEEKNAELEERAAELREEIELRRVAVKLLEETGARIRNQVGPSVTRFVRGILPRLTSDRYRDVRVDNDLRVSVFASEKNEFMDIAEMSGGTLASLKLAVRLAASHALIHTRSGDPQFVFLDEPFKMVDDGRAADVLACLRRLSAELPQVFVVQPAFSERQREQLDFCIRTDPSGSQLAVDGQRPGDPPPNGDGPPGGDIADRSHRIYQS